MATLLTAPGGYHRISAMFGGSSTFGAETPNAGSSTEQWKNDTTWYGTSGDACSSSAGGGVRSAGDNGKDHWQNNKIGNTQGHYLSTEITGFKFKASQESGAGHGLYIRRYGFLLAKKDRSQYYFYDAGGVLSRGSSGTKDYSHNFSRTILNQYLSNGWVFTELRYQVSSQGGTGSRSTSVIVYDFQFNYVNESGKQVILPIKRPWADRNNFKIA